VIRQSHRPSEWEKQMNPRMRLAASAAMTATIAGLLGASAAPETISLGGGNDTFVSTLDVVNSPFTARNDIVGGGTGTDTLQLRGTLWSLIRVRPEMITGPPVAQEMAAKVERLLDESLVSAVARRELDALRYAIAITRRY
jgi:hypothetical protein